MRRFSFNRSIRIGSRRDRITGDSGALTGRELLGRSRVVRFLAKRLPDKRDGRRVRHSQRRLARTLLLLAGQGRREHSDATEPRDDPALRLATSDRAGTAPLGKGAGAALAADAVAAGGGVVGEGRRRGAARGVAAAGGVAAEGDGRVAASEDAGHRHRQLPAEVTGNSRAARGTATITARVSSGRGGGGETGDILDLRLREGQVHTADGGLEFVLEVLGAAELHLCGKAAVRFDAGYPGEPLMAALEERGTHYVAGLRNNAVLKRLALPAMDAAVWDALSNGVPAGEPPHLGLRVVLPGRVVVPFPPGRAGRRRAAGRTHSRSLLAAGFDALRGDGRRGLVRSGIRIRKRIEAEIAKALEKERDDQRTARKRPTRRKPTASQRGSGTT